MLKIIALMIQQIVSLQLRKLILKLICHSIYIRLNVCTVSIFILKYHLLIIEKNILDLFSSKVLYTLKRQYAAY